MINWELCFSHVGGSYEWVVHSVDGWVGGMYYLEAVLPGLKDFSRLDSMRTRNAR
jgi:hypothetical protein